MMDELDAITQLTSAMKKADFKPRRTAMGEYIVPPGGKPLTSLGDCNPAPSDYSPKIDLSKPSPPQYSIAGPYKAAKSDYNASAADNDTQLDMKWKNKTHTLKDKGKMRPYDIRDAAHISTSMGAARYHVKHQNFGSGSPRWSVAERHLQGVNAGPPNRLVQPVDTHGVDNPAPTYTPSSKYWGHGALKSFGLSRKDKLPEGPGPAEYTIARNQRGGPAYSLAKKLPPTLHWQQVTNTDSPGPGAYNLDTTIGKAMAKSLAARNIVERENWVPAPNLYTLPDVIKKMEGPSATLSYRWFPEEDKPHPGPTRYDRTCVNLPKKPIFSIRKQTKPCFPDILSYPLTARPEMSKEPGPGSYEHGDSRNISINDNPKFSMGKRASPPKNEVPGPNRYMISRPEKPEAQRAPSFSMGKRIQAIDKRVSPGPAAYYPLVKNGTGHSMTKRPTSHKKFTTPAPNAYKLQNGQTNCGQFSGPRATLKARASPYVYSGIHIP